MGRSNGWMAVAWACAPVGCVVEPGGPDGSSPSAGGGDDGGAAGDTDAGADDGDDAGPTTGDAGGQDGGSDPPAGSEGGPAASSDEGAGATDGGEADDALGTTGDGGDATFGDGDDAGAGTGDPSPFDYGPCGAGCPGDACMTIDGFDGSFCTTDCVNGQCPAPTESDASPFCGLGPDLSMPPVNCVLTCFVSEQNCPTGMTCVDAMMGGDPGICLYL